MQSHTPSCVLPILMLAVGLPARIATAADDVAGLRELHRTEHCFRRDPTLGEVYADCFGQEWPEESITVFEGLARDHADPERAARARFFLGAALEAAGRREDAVDVFEQIVEEPAAPHAVDAWSRIGAYLFEIERNPVGAIRAYRRASEDPIHPEHARILYRLGRCYSLLGEHTKAVETFQRAVEVSPDAPTRELALAALVDEHASWQELAEAGAYFERIDRADLIRATARRIAEDGYSCRFDWKSSLLQRLLHDEPAIPERIEIRTRLVEICERMGRRHQAEVERERLRLDLASLERAGEPGFVHTDHDPASTFPVDGDAASYTLARRRLHDGTLPSEAEIRVEEFLNAFAYRSLLPLSAAVGAGMLPLADGLARVVLPGRELPVGVITALIGAPALLGLLLARRR